MKFILLWFILLSNLLTYSLGFFKKESLSFLKKEKSEFNSKFTFEKFSIDKTQFNKFYFKNTANQVPATPVPGPAPTTGQAPAPILSKFKPLSESLYRYTNSSISMIDSNTFKKDHRRWDYKILDKELEEIFSTMVVNQEKGITINGLKKYIQIFVNNYESCDKDKDNVLMLSEFVECLKVDPYLSKVTIPPKDSHNTVDYSDPNVFYKAVYDLLNEKQENYLNFVDYMKLRLFVFALQQCSVVGPFLEEVGFECAIDIISGYKTFSRTSARKLFQLALDLSNNPNNINLDFIPYINIASAVRLFSSINGKKNDDITLSEFNLALDRNNLPNRYNQENISFMFKLVEEEDRLHQGIDLKTFILLDSWMRLFSPMQVSKKYRINSQEFSSIFTNTNFPQLVLNEIQNAPDFILTPQSYNMYQSMNTSKFTYENDFFSYKFLEIEAKVDKILNYNMFEAEKGLQAPTAVSVTPATTPAAIPAGSASNVPASSAPVSPISDYTVSLLFSASDVDIDGFLTFYDFGIMMQISYLFAKQDPSCKYILTASELHELFTNYSDFPIISSKLKKKAERFSEFHSSTSIDIASALQILRIEDIVEYFDPGTDHSNILEIDLNTIMHKVNLINVPHELYQDCFRGVDYRNLPLYDWNCCFTKGMSKNLEFYDTMNNYLLAMQNKYVLTSTAFYNVDMPNVLLRTGG